MPKGKRRSPQRPPGAGRIAPAPNARVSRPARVIDPAAKRAAVLDAGERLFAAGGFAATTMADIAAEAGVAVGTLYRFFPDKASLLAALHARLEDRFIAAMTRGWRAAADPREAFAPMIEALFDEAERARAAMPLYAMTRDSVSAADFTPGARMIAAIGALYEEGCARGAYHRHEPRIAAAIAHGMVDGAMRAWMTGSETRAAVGAALNMLFVRAFATPASGP
ncbi:MAG: helix-turn-helix domain-containing protein [Hyphomonadaceae bacterium]|nr:helix-turn-helix domain-containing protein [Hyphomonadaceae bacterium]